MKVNAQCVQQDCTVKRLVWLIRLVHVMKGSIVKRDLTLKQILFVLRDTFVQKVVPNHYLAHWERLTLSLEPQIFQAVYFVQEEPTVEKLVSQRYHVTNLPQFFLFSCSLPP